MTPIRMKTVWTVLIAFAVTGLLPVTAYFGIKFFLAKLITRDTAAVIFDQFQATLDKGSIFIHDPMTAASVAERAYREYTQGPAVDGWTHLLRISAVVHGSSCDLMVLSAGPDGAFGTADDLATVRTFDLAPHTAKVATAPRLP